MKQHLAHHALRGRALVQGCGRGHELALSVEQGLDATGLDIAPTGTAGGGDVSPSGALRGRSLFDTPGEMRGAYDVVLEHTCMCAPPPASRPDHRRIRSDTTCSPPESMM